MKIVGKADDLSESKDKTKCPHCGDWFQNIGQHWSLASTCDHLPIEGKKWEILLGLWIGDGYICASNKNAYMKIGMINRTFIEHIWEELGWLATDVKEKIEAPEQATDDIEAINTHDYYVIQTRCHPAFNVLLDHQNKHDGAFPKNLSASPMLLKMWYVSDGGLDWNRKSDNSQVRFTSRNESGRPEAIMNLMDSAGFDITNGDKGYNFRVPTNQTHDFFNYIGEAPPGFEYKWAYENRYRYQRLKEKFYQQHCTQTIESDVYAAPS